jgi:cell division protein FtsA
MLRDNLRQGGVLDALTAGCVLTGGGARLVGIIDIADQVLRCPIRIAGAGLVPRMPASLADPEFSAAVGLLLYVHRSHTGRISQQPGLREKFRSLFVGA